MGVLIPRGVRSEAGGLEVRGRPFRLSSADLQYWAFQPVVRPAIPALAEGTAGQVHPIDALLLPAMQARGVSPNPLATPRELVRRVYFDLLGLPPSPDEVAAFERDASDSAWAAMVDRLLASPHYGERWGRHWLDVVRYAESNGYERDGEKPNAWRYRDYVIAALNRDKPYDRFIREQLAGDELADEELASVAGGLDWRDAMVATGFYRLHVWDDEPDSTVAAEYDDLDDILMTTSTAFLGLTISCARCHDHKFDPISQRDYYALLAFIRSIDGYGQHKTGGGGRGTGMIQRPLVPPDTVAAWEADRDAHVRALESQLARAPAGEATRAIEIALVQARGGAPPFDHALAVAEIGPEPRPTHLLARGDALSPREEVAPAFPAVLGLAPPTIPIRHATARTTGRRRVLADWIASPENPLTARVLVNRVWQKHFGTGIVPTPDDFGQTGLPPTNPALLDFLAAEFVANGWSLKRLHTLILTSRAYRQSSRTDNPAAMTVDESNTLYWRQSLRRLEAEAVRDTMLAVAGTLNLKPGGPSVFPTLAAEVHETQDASGKGWVDSPPEEQNRRSVYLAVKRALKIPLLESLDFVNSASPVAVRPSTTTAPQALMMLNDPFVNAQAAALAARLYRDAGEDVTARLALGFQMVLQRGPTDAELAGSARFLAEQHQQAKRDGVANPDQAAWVSLCRALLNLNEMIYVD